jgi:hypothetical protein
MGKEVNYITKIFKKLRYRNFLQKKIISAEVSVRIKKSSTNSKFKIMVFASFNVHIVPINT